MIDRRHFLGGVLTSVASAGCKSEGSDQSSTGVDDSTTTGAGTTSSGGTSTTDGTSATDDTASTGEPEPDLPQRPEPDPIIDTHMHVWGNDPDVYPFPYPYDPNFTEPQHEATVEMLIEDMDRNGCTHCVLVQVIYHGWDNSYVADALALYPDRFKVHGLIDPTNPQVADELQFWMEQRGLHGMRFSAIYYQNGQYGGDAWLEAPETHELWDRAEQLGAVFNFFIAPGQLSRLGTMALAHPGVPVVVDHLGRVDMADGNSQAQLDELLALADLPNVFVKVSELDQVSGANEPMYPYQDTWPYVQQVYAAFGGDRLLWGTGYPGDARAAFNRPPLDLEIALIRDMIPGISEDDRAKILGRNAAMLWGFT